MFCLEVLIFAVIPTIIIFFYQNILTAKIISFNARILQPIFACSLESALVMSLCSRDLVKTSLRIITIH